MRKEENLTGSKLTPCYSLPVVLLIPREDGLDVFPEP
jgi:hypothetical protein